MTHDSLLDGTCHWEPISVSRPVSHVQFMTAPAYQPRGSENRRYVSLCVTRRKLQHGESSVSLYAIDSVMCLRTAISYMPRCRRPRKRSLKFGGVVCVLTCYPLFSIQIRDEMRHGINCECESLQMAPPVPPVDPKSPPKRPLLCIFSRLMSDPRQLDVTCARLEAQYIT